MYKIVSLKLCRMHELVIRLKVIKIRKLRQSAELIICTLFLYLKAYLSVYPFFLLINLLRHSPSYYS